MKLQIKFIQFKIDDPFFNVILNILSKFLPPLLFLFLSNLRQRILIHPLKPILARVYTMHALYYNNIPGGLM